MGFMRVMACRPLRHAIIHRSIWGHLAAAHTLLGRCGRRPAAAGGGVARRGRLARGAGHHRAAPRPRPWRRGDPGALADCTPMTNFRAERQFGTFSAADAW